VGEAAPGLCDRTKMSQDVNIYKAAVNYFRKQQLLN